MKMENEKLMENKRLNDLYNSLSSEEIDFIINKIDQKYLMEEAEEYIKDYIKSHIPQKDIQDEDIEVPYEHAKKLSDMFIERYQEEYSKEQTWKCALNIYFDELIKKIKDFIRNEKIQITYINHSDKINLIKETFFEPGISRLSKTENAERIYKIFSDLSEPYKEKKVYEVKFLKEGYADILAHSKEDAMYIADHLMHNSIDWIDDQIWEPVSVQDSEREYDDPDIITKPDFED